MALTQQYLESVIETKDTEAALDTGQCISWSIIDGALVVYDIDDPPSWVPANELRDDDGNTVGQLELVMADG